MDRERWSKRLTVAAYAASLLTIGLGAVQGDQVLVLGGLVVLALLLVFDRL